MIKFFKIFILIFKIFIVNFFIMLLPVWMIITCTYGVLSMIVNEEFTPLFKYILVSSIYIMNFSIVYIYFKVWLLTNKVNKSNKIVNPNKNTNKFYLESYYAKDNDIEEDEDDEEEVVIPIENKKIGGYIK